MFSDAGGLIKRHSSTFSLLQRALDVAVVVLALILATTLHGVPMDAAYWLGAALAVLVFQLGGEATHLYGSWRVYSFDQEAAELAAVGIAAVLVLVTAAFLTKTSDQYSRVVIVLWLVFAFSGLALERLAIRTMLRSARARGRNTRLLAIAGASELAARVAERIVAAEWLGMTFAGFYDDAVPPGSQPLPGRPYAVVGDLAALVQAAGEGRLDFVYIALPLAEQGKVMALIRDLSDTTASVFVVPDFLVFDFMHARWTSVDGMPVVSVFDSPFLGADGILKRLEDILLSIVALIVTAPVMLAAAIGVKLSSPGPVLFKQRRYGLSGKTVEVWKFRTMTVHEDSDDIPQARRDDPRVTRFGAFLRRTSLDELPQFINVLQGHMSVIGPRPHAVAHNEQYRGLVQGYMIRHKVKPGISGWAQVNGWRGETDTIEKMQKRVECDLYYIRNWSLWLDAKILALTLVRGFVHPSAY